MLISRGKRNLIIAGVVIVAVAVGFFTYRSYSNTKFYCERLFKELFFTEYAYNKIDYDQLGTYQEYIDELDKVRDKRLFNKLIVSAVDEYTEICRRREEAWDKYYNDEGPKPEDIETSYGDKPSYSSASERFIGAAGFFKAADYYNEDLNESFQNFYADWAHYIRERKDPDYTEVKNDLENANSLYYVLSEVKDFNGSRTDGFKIDTASVCTEDEIRGLFQGAIDEACETKDLKLLAEALEDATSIEEVSNEGYMESSEILDLYLEDSYQINTLLKGIGGYYDDDDSPQNCYGDYYYETNTVGPKNPLNEYNDNPEMKSWLIQNGYYDNIQEHNRTRTTITSLCKGKDININIPSLKEEGYGYVYVNEDGTQIFVSPNAIKLFDNKEDTWKINDVEIRGDFSDIYSEMEKEYRESHVNGASDDFLASSEPVTEGEYALYTGTFTFTSGADESLSLRSEFRMKDGQIYWICYDSPFNFYVDGIKVHTVFENPTPVEDMKCIEVYEGWTSQVIFEDNIIKTRSNFGGTNYYAEYIREE